jgi:hypothetical protein
MTLIVESALLVRSLFFVVWCARLRMDLPAMDEERPSILLPVMHLF